MDHGAVGHEVRREPNERVIVRPDVSSLDPLHARAELRSGRRPCAADEPVETIDRVALLLRVGDRCEEKERRE